MEQKNNVANTTEVQNPATMGNKEFIVRLVTFVLFGCVLPFSFVSYRYELFKSPHSTLTGVGFIAVILVLVFAIYILNMVKKAHPHTMTTQVINGYTKIVIFIILPLLWVQSVKGDIEMFEQVLEVIALCELIAVPVNPLPKWAFERNIEFTTLSLKSAWKTVGKFIK